MQVMRPFRQSPEVILWAAFAPAPPRWAWRLWSRAFRGLPSPEERFTVVRVKGDFAALREQWARKLLPGLGGREREILRRLLPYLPGAVEGERIFSVLPPARLASAPGAIRLLLNPGGGIKLALLIIASTLAWAFLLVLAWLSPEPRGARFTQECESRGPPLKTELLVVKTVAQQNAPGAA